MTPVLLTRPLLYVLTALMAAAIVVALPVLAHAEAATVPASSAADVSYTLGSGDKVRVNVFGEADLSGEFVVDDSGFLRLPLVGQIAAGGRTVRQLEGDLAAKLGSQYLKSPRVSIEVVNYRPFYIIGEFNKPGEYPFVANMSAINAVAVAGGYTYRRTRARSTSSARAKRKKRNFPPTIRRSFSQATS